ncbi:2-5A-dependent ribonuclease-like [Mytilus edulis]|uniref:2-5A-dependent ribonuclease-like n=1 Tax=Mytilus edulis TaxID=6550 RepID=UPI0039F07289
MQSKECSLINAVVEGRRKDVSKLLDDGANVNHAENRSGLDTTPLYVAVCNNEIEIVNILFRHGADPNIPDKDGKTPLFMALYDDVDIKIFELLIDHGADVNFCNVSGENALLSLFKDCTTIGEGRCYTRISRLLELSKDVLSPNPEGKCPIHFIHVIHPSEEEQSSKSENHNCVDFLQRLLQRVHL